MALSNPLETFIWGAGGARKTPEEIAREREIAAALMAQGVDTSPVGHWTQGAARVVNALGGVLREKRADKAAGQNAADSQARIAKLLGGMGGQTSQFPPAPVSGGAQTSAAPPDYASQRVAQAFGDAPAPVNLSGNKQAFIDALLPAAIEESRRTGVDPRIIVAQAAQETGWGKSAPGNNFFGIKSHGKGGGQNLTTHEVINGQRVKINDSFRTFASPADSVRGYGDFLLENPRYRGMREAQGLDAQLAALGASGYATDPNYANSVGAIARSIQLPDGANAMPTMSLGPAAAPQAASAVPGGAPMPEMAGNAPQPVQVAQNGNNMQAIIEALSSPYASAQEKDIAGILLQQNMQQNDPMRAMEMEKMRMEMDALRNPKPKYDFITGRDGSIFRTDSTGNMQQVYGGKPEQPTDVREYEYARGQGFQGTFADWQLAQKRAGASQVNIDQKTEGAFDKKLAEGQAQTINDMATEGMNARADLAIIGELETLLGQNGGTTSGIAGWLAQRGIGGEGMSDLQAAQALINKLVPTQRQPGSGSMSDRDVELFTRSLPSLWNTPGGNQKILGVMRGLAQYKQAQGDIAARVLSGQMSRQEATAALRALPNPLAQTGKGSRIERNGYIIEQVD